MCALYEARIEWMEEKIKKLWINIGRTDSDMYAYYALQEMERIQAVLVKYKGARET